MASKVLGIDLGTTNTCVAVLRGTGATVIPNNEGQRTTPSVVAFAADGQRLVGSVAKRQALTNPRNTVYSIKRFMGRRYCEVLDELDFVPYEVVSASNGDAHIQIGDRVFSPPELSAALLQRIRMEAEGYLGEPVTQAIITVPAYFNDSQRNATRDAGRIAGLEVLQILNEPTASALAYGLESRTAGRIAVFDFGGGTFDISLLEIRNGTYEVLATNGDTHLGGDDIDLEIIFWLLERFHHETGLDLSRDSAALQRLKEAAERAKCELSSALTTDINLPFLAADATGPKHLRVEISRSQLERLAQPILERTAEPCRRALEDAGVGPEDIHEVILVGGATRMPAITELVKTIFDREPVKGVNPDEAVAVGAAIRGAILTGDLDDMQLRDVTPLTLGIETEGGEFAPIVKRNSILPITRKEVFSTAADNQTNVRIKVFQGERPLAGDNRLLGNFSLAGITPGPRAAPRIEVMFTLDQDGILRVCAADLGSGKEQTVLIEAASGLTEEEVDRLRREAKLFEDEDRRRHEETALRTHAEQVLHSFQDVVKKLGRGIKDSDRQTLRCAAYALRDELAAGSPRGIEVALEEVRSVLERFRDKLEGRQKKKKNGKIRGNGHGSTDGGPDTNSLGRAAQAS